MDNVVPKRDVPDIEQDDWTWLPIPKLARTVPFGYLQSEDDPEVLIPIPSELNLLEDAKEHLKSYSSRNVAAWLSAQTGRKISHMGLLKRLESDKQNQTKARSANYWAEKYAKAKAIAEKYEVRRLGARNFSTSIKEHRAADASLKSLIEERRAGTESATGDLGS